MLPHEILHSLADANTPYVFDSILCGQMDERSRVQFWRHVMVLQPWQDHPVLRDPEVDLSHLLPLCIHGDGAVMKRDDEVFVWSMSSFFGTLGSVKDVLLFKYPLCIIPERLMRSENAASAW